jgi:hypothetical protein
MRRRIIPANKNDYVVILGGPHAWHHRYCLVIAALAALGALLALSLDASRRIS